MDGELYNGICMTTWRGQLLLTESFLYSMCNCRSTVCLPADSLLSFSVQFQYHFTYSDFISWSRKAFAVSTEKRIFHSTYVLKVTLSKHTPESKHAFKQHLVQAARCSWRGVDPQQINAAHKTGASAWHGGSASFITWSKHISAELQTM